MTEYFVEKCKNFSLDVSKETLSKFESLYEMLIEENKKYNLTAITEKDKVYLLHFLDSLSASPFIPENSSLCDVGSGGGFPAIPLKLLRDDLSVTMTDSVTKKVNWLNTVCSHFSLQNCRAIHTRIEDFSRSTARESFDVVTARAVAKLNTLCEYCLPLVKIGGIFIAYKSFSEEELKEASNAIKILGGKLKSVENVSISDDYTRTLIIIEKISQTPTKYPRGKNKERTNPIV